jgi:tRNA (mo5U34)-methyltransferase
LFGIHIDTEWRSDWKWDRLSDHLTPLAGRRVLDIGCGSGYYCWRMRGAGAEFVLGLDPTLVYVMQFLLLQHYINDQQVQVLPLGIEEFAQNCQCFDTVFSMGLLYHRRDPQQHLTECAQCLRAGGELILETLVIDNEEGEVLVPQDRYAQMRNVWAIPSVNTLTQWLQQAGYRNVRCVDVHRTSTDEQRSTEWMTFQSLADYLDPADPEKTIEGYPAPQRAIMLATK